MYGRAGLDRFKKAQSVEPFSVTTVASASKPTITTQSAPEALTVHHKPIHVAKTSTGKDAVPLVVQAPSQITQIGGGQSNWQPPDWAIEPRPGVYYLEVLKGTEVLDRINLDKKRHIFGRQFQACDFVLDHQSVSRQHAVVIPHKNGSIYVIDLGSAHGTFVANERLTKETPIELEVGQSLRFAASTRSYVLRKNNSALFPPRPPLADIKLPPPPDPSDEEAVVAYNTIINRYGLGKSNEKVEEKYEKHQTERATKRIKRAKVTFRDQVGGELVEVVGVSDGADVETEPGPMGAEGGSLVGKYGSLVEITVIPKGEKQVSTKEESKLQRGVTDKLQEILNKVKSAPPKGGMYEDLYGETFSGKVGSSWAYSSVNNSSSKQGSPKLETKAKADIDSTRHYDEDDDDLFGD